MNSRPQGHMYCNHCGEQVPAGSKFCQACGQPLTNPTKRQTQEKPNEKSQVTLGGYKKGKWLLIAPGFVIAGFILFLLLRLLSPSAYNRSLVGKWDYISTNAGYDAFQEDIEFYTNGTCYIPSPFLRTKTLQYSFPKSGRLRFNADNISVEYDYTLSGDNLRIYFEDGGYNDYVRSGAKSSGSTPGDITYDVITSKNIDGLEHLPIYQPGFLGIGKQKNPTLIFGNVTWSPNSRYLYIPFHNGVVDVYESDLIMENFVNKNSKAVFPDGTKYIHGNEIYDKSGQVLLEFSGSLIQISPDSKYVVTCEQDAKRIILWDVMSSQIAIEFPQTQPGIVDFLGFSNSGMIAAIVVFQAGDPDHVRIELWDTKTWKVTKQLPFDMVLGSGESCGSYRVNQVSAARFTRDDQRLAVWLANTCESGSKIYILDVASGTYLQAFSIDKVSYLNLKKLDFSFDGQLLFAYSEEPGSSSNSVYIYDLANSKWLAPLTISQGSTFIGLSPDGRFLIYDSKLFGVRK